MKNSRSFVRRSSRRRGGILLVAIAFAAISALTVGSFIKLAHHELRLSNVQFYSNESLNLAEAGLEEALYALNHERWEGWDTDNTDARMAVENIQIGRAATGTFRVLIEDRFSLDPIITAQGDVTSGSGLTTSKQIQITLRRITFFGNSITARHRVLFMGNNSEVESYFSSEGRPGEADRRDNGSVASLSVDAGSVDLRNADIWGFVFTGGHQPNVGPNGSILGEDSPTGERIDSDRVTTDFNADLPVAQQPNRADAIPLGPITETMVLPRPGTGEENIRDRYVIYQTDRVNLTGRQLRIEGNVILIVDGNMDVSGGGGKLEVGEDSKLRLYSYQRMKISGSAELVNETHIPSNLIIFGMNPTLQEFEIGGNASWEAAVYAPNADIELNGGGSEGWMAGGVVGRNVKLNGGTIFHGDEDLAGFTEGFGFAMNEWSELERADWITLTN